MMAVKEEINVLKVKLNVPDFSKRHENTSFSNFWPLMLVKLQLRHTMMS